MNTVNRNSSGVADPIQFSELAQFKVIRVNPLPAWENLHTAGYATGIYDYWQEVIAKSPDYDPVQEQFATIFLTGQRKIMGHALIAKGTFTSVVASPPEAFRAAIIAGAPEIVVAHNHPQDSPKPSDADCGVYIRMVIVAKLVGVKLLDSMVIGEKTKDYPLGFARLSEDKRVESMGEKFIQDAEKMGLVPPGTANHNTGLTAELQALVDAAHREDVAAQWTAEEIRGALSVERESVPQHPEYDPENEVRLHTDANGQLIAAHCGNEFGAIGDWQWENAKKKLCPKCSQRLPMTARQKKAWRRHAIKVALRVGLIMCFLALAFGLHSSWREGLAFGLMDLATGPITDNLWEAV